MRCSPASRSTRRSRTSRRFSASRGVATVYPIAPKTPSNSYAVQLAEGSAGLADVRRHGRGQLDRDHRHRRRLHARRLRRPGNEGRVPDGARQRHGRPDVSGSEQDSTEPRLRGRRRTTRTRTDPGFDPTPAPDTNPLDCNSHGTHIAGTHRRLRREHRRQHVHRRLQRARRARRRHVPGVVQDRAGHGPGREDLLLQGLRLPGQHRTSSARPSTGRPTRTTTAARPITST